MTTTRPVRFAPLRLDGTGPPSIASGAKYTVTPTRAYIDTDAGGRVEQLGFTVTIGSEPVTADLPVTPIDNGWLLEIRSIFPLATGGYRSFNELVIVPAGTETIAFADLPRATEIGATV